MYSYKRRDSASYSVDSPACWAAPWASSFQLVDKDNPARHLYERLGFTIIEERDSDLLMVRTLAAADGSYIGPGWEELAVLSGPVVGR